MSLFCYTFAAVYIICSVCTYGRQGSPPAAAHGVSRVRDACNVPQVGPPHHLTIRTFHKSHLHVAVLLCTGVCHRSAHHSDCCYRIYISLFLVSHDRLHVSKTSGCYSSSETSGLICCHTLSTFRSPYAAVSRRCCTCCWLMFTVAPA
jgi:hypothetical protein